MKEEPVDGSGDRLVRGVDRRQVQHEHPLKLLHDLSRAQTARGREDRPQMHTRSRVALVEESLQVVQLGARLIQDCGPKPACQAAFSCIDAVRDDSADTRTLGATKLEDIAEASGSAPILNRAVDSRRSSVRDDVRHGEGCDRGAVHVW